MTESIAIKKTEVKGELQLSPITVTEEYRKEWNITSNDFVCLTRNGELLRPTLYRVGGLGDPKPWKDRYFMIIKHVEAFYEKRILDMCKENDPKHLEGRWVIIDHYGNEKVEFPAFKHGRIVKDSCIYSIDGKFFNIETGEYYADASRVVESGEFLFLQNSYDKDKSRCGVMKINKSDGKWELFPE